MSAKPVAPATTLERAPPAFHLLAKPTGAVCNLDCAYCFFLSKEMLYPGSRFRMADELLETYLRQLIESHSRMPEVMIAWQGGEPTLMGARVLPPLGGARGALPAARASARPTRSRRTARCSTRSGRRSSGEHDFLVGISIDGPREMHDAYRVNKGGQGTSTRSCAASLTSAPRGVEYNVLTTVHAANADRGREVYRFLRDDCGARFIQFIPIIERVAEATEDGRCRGRPGATGRSTSKTATRHRAVGLARGLRTVPDRRLRGVGPSRRRRGVRPDVRHRARELGRRAAGPVRSLRDVRTRARARAHRRRLLLRSLRRAALPARQHHATPHARPGRLRAAATVRPGQTRHAPALLPRMRRPLRLPRRLPEGPLHRPPPTANRGSTTSAPATRRSFITSTSRCAHGRAARRGSRAGRDHALYAARTRNAAATTLAPAGPAASGSTATGPDRRSQSSRARAGRMRATSRATTVTR